MRPRAIMQTHPSFPFYRHQDATGPERILSFYDPASQMRAVIVIDTTAFGMSAGGVRMLPDLSVEEMIRLARAMTYKYLMLEFPAGGAKAGIWYDPATQNRQAVMDAFLRVLQPLYEQRTYYPGADMGTSDDDFLPLRNKPGKRRYSGLRATHFEGLPLEDQLTGFGVVESALVAARAFQLPIRGAAVAIEGFGKVGGGAARFFARAGARVVAVSTLAGTRHDPKGLDVERLLDLRQEYGDDAVRQYRGGRLLSRSALFTLPVDILIPGARPDVIHAKNVDRIQARLVVPAANIPFRPSIANRLSQRGIGVVPDFVSNGGGVLAALADIQGLGTKESFAFVSERIRKNTRLVLSRSKRSRCTPFEAAFRIVRERWKKTAHTQQPLVAKGA